MDSPWAWLAGLFEGEGWIGLQYSKTGNPQATIKISMTDRDVLENVAKIAGGKVLGPYYNKGNIKPYYSWGLYSKQGACGTLVAILPWLGMRRQAKAFQVLEAMGWEP